MLFDDQPEECQYAHFSFIKAPVKLYSGTSIEPDNSSILVVWPTKESWSVALSQKLRADSNSVSVMSFKTDLVSRFRVELLLVPDILVETDFKYNGNDGRQ